MIKRIKKSLALKWMIFPILLATIPLAITGYNIIQIYQNDLKKSVMELEEMKGNMVVERTEAFLEKVIDNLFFLTKDEYFGNRSSHTKKHLETLLYQYDYFVELTLLDGKGQETIKISKNKVFGHSDLKNQSESEMFKRASNGLIYYGDFSLSEDVVPKMVVSIPIKEERGKSVSVLSAKINIQYLWNLLPQTRIGGRGSTYVVDKEGYLIAHPDTRQVLLRLNMFNLPMVKEVIGGREGYLEFKDLHGERYFVVYKPIKEVGWGVVVQVPVEEAYEPIRKVAHTALRWILVALSVALILSILFTRRFIHPIKQLSDEMAKVSEGNLDVHIEATHQDEIGLLTKSFNQMIQNLKRSQGALKQAEEKYRTIFENSKDMVYITSPDGKFIDVNQAGVDMFDYESKEALFKISARDTYFQPKDRETFQNEIAKEGFVKDFEAKLKRKDGTPIDCLITATVRRDGEGHIIGYEGIIKNISTRKRMEKELLHRAEELQILYDLSALINQTLDLDRVLPIALEKVMSLMGFAMGSIHLVNEIGDTLELKFDLGQPQNLTESIKFFKVGEGVCGKAFQLKQPIILSIDQYPTPRLIPFLKNEGIQTLVGIPLLVKERAIGAISLVSRSPREISPREVNLLESIGNQIGLALENAKLFSNIARAKSEWETTFDSVTDLITIRYKDHRILRANKAAFKRYGMKPIEMIRRKCYEILHHRESPCEGCYISETLRTKKPISGERESKYLNGVFQYHTFPIYDDSGDVIAVVDLAREITEQKKQEMEKELVNNINKIVASSLDVREVMKAVHSELKRVLDSERMTISLMEEGEEGFRYFALEKDDDTKELVEGVIYPKKGTPFEKVTDAGMPIIVPDTEKSDSWLNQKLLREGIRSSLVFPLEYKGRIIGTLNFGSRKANHFSEGQFNFLQQVAPGLAIAIQNSLLLEEIKTSEEKYRTVVEGALDGVCVIGQDYRVLYVNDRAAEIGGYSREELTGVDFRNLLDEESKQLVADRYIRRRRGEEVPSRYEFNTIRKDGGKKNVEVSSNIVKDSKGEINTIAFLKDITEKRRLEEQLFQTEKLRALGEMASGVAHDFNNALAAILGNTQLLLYTAKEEEVRETLQTIERVAKDSAQTVRRLQDFTRKRVHQELFKLDINTIIKETIKITKPKWKDEVQRKGIHIEVVSNLEEIPPVEGNASELREAITNMIFNAIEAMPKGGKIEIRTFKREKEVYIQISDTGVGMTEEIRKKIFEPFFTTKPFTNTGLGLSMSYGIIKRFGGEIKVEGGVGQGTTFTISLPIGLEGKEEVAPPPIIKEGREAQILVVDDEETVRNVLSRILSQVNHRVTVAENGEEGIRLFNEKEFDLVLTDLGMPGLSGWEVCRMIKKVSPHTPVGMITGWGMELDSERMKDSGIDFIISKPFDLNQILKEVDKTLESKEKTILA